MESEPRDYGCVLCKFSHLPPTNPVCLVCHNHDFYLRYNQPPTLRHYVAHAKLRLTETA